MTITVLVGTVPVPTSIIFVEMAPWKGQPKTTTHEIDGANYSKVIHSGKKSKSTTIRGYCKRTAANLAILDSLDNGTPITVTHSVEGTRTGIVTALQLTASAGGLFVSFSMTVVEQ